MTVELIHGDCLEVMRSLPDASVDAVIADPPYGTTACKWDAVIPFAPMWEALLRVAKPSAAVVLFAGQPFTSALVMSQPRLFRYDWVWRKGQKTNFLNAKKQPLREHESVLVFSVGANVYNPQMGSQYIPTLKGTRRGPRSQYLGITNKDTPVADVATRYPSSVLDFAKGRHNLTHATEKPVDLCAYLVRTYTNPGDTVLDFCAGSFTTGVACLREGRNFVGIEKDPGYFAIGSERMREEERRIESARAQLALPLGAD